MEAARRLGLGEEIVSTIRRALAEDIGSGDVTTDSMVGLEANARAQIGNEICAVVSIPAIPGVIREKPVEGH